MEMTHPQIGVCTTSLVKSQFKGRSVLGTPNQTWAESPIIVITGPINGVSITNETTDELLELVYNIPSGRVVTINLAHDKKTIEDDLGTNLRGAISSDSDLATFHLAPDPEAADGNNTIAVSGSGAEPGTTSIAIQYYNRYGGI